MKKFFFVILITLFFLTIFLSYFGVETHRFDGLIQNKANDINRYIKIDFNNTKIYLNPSKLNLAVKLQNPKILVKNDEIILSKLDLFISLKSFFNSDFLLKRAEIAFTKNDIKDLTKISNIFLPKMINKKLKNIFQKGNLEGEFVIPFEPDGSIGKGYGFSGKISKASINLTKEFSIKNLSTDIVHIKDGSIDGFDIEIKNGYIYDLKIAGSKINLKREKNKVQVKSLLRTKGKLNFDEIKKVSKLMSLNFSNLKDVNAVMNIKTKINFDLENQMKLTNLFSSTEGDISHLEIRSEKIKIIKKYLPSFESNTIFKDITVKNIFYKSNNTLELKGLVKVKDYFDTFQVKQNYNYNNKTSDISGSLNLTNSQIKIARLNYNKDYKKNSQVSFDIQFILNKYFNIKNLSFLEGKSKIHLSNIKLNKDFEIKDFKKFEIITYQNKIKNNDFLIKKSDETVISGSIFDAQPLLKTLFKSNKQKIFSKKFNSNLKINFDKVFTGTDDDISSFALIAIIKKGSFNTLSLKGNYSDNEIIEMSIYQINENQKTLQIISDRAKPFIKNFDFIEGFEGGKLEYESTISKEFANSNLIIKKFKVSKVPALAKLLTLASLQGIADTLGGEGIRFESFEMKSESKGNIINILDVLAIGPAVSILLDGYVDKGKVVSLRGTLVPATKLNEIIASIPLVGDILVGKKTGEGVVGVSFKMKGPPKNIKTTVNPIKTLTPRFIVRAIEKIKKNKKKETK